MTTVQECMTEGAVTCPPDTTLHEAAQEMRDRSIGSLLCVEEGEVKGIVTDRDIVIRGVADGAGPDEATVAEICTTPVAAIGPAEPLSKAIELAHERHVRRLAVIDGGKPVGVISMRDLDSVT